MAKQTINIGTVANDGTGDRLRTAMDKVNDNFNELYSGAYAVRSATFANPLAMDGTTYKNWKCASVTGDTTVNLTGVSDGEAGYIELIIDGAGGHTISLGSMFTKQFGPTVMDTAALADNLISWVKSGTDIFYTIMQKV